MEQKNYIHGIFLCYQNIFEENNQILLLSKKNHTLTNETGAFKSLLVTGQNYENYSIYIAISIENSDDRLEHLLISFKKDLKNFLSFQNYERFSHNPDNFEKFLLRFSKRVDYYISPFFLKSEMSNLSIYFLFKILKKSLLKFTPYYTLSEDLNYDLIQIFSKIMDPIEEHLNLFSRFSNSFVPLGYYVSFKELVLLSFLDNELVYYLSSFNEFYSNFLFFCNKTIFRREKSRLFWRFYHNSENNSFQRKNFANFVLLL